MLIHIYLSFQVLNKAKPIMDTTPSHPEATVNASQAQIAQKTWEIANSIQGTLTIFNHYHVHSTNKTKTQLNQTQKRDQRRGRVVQVRRGGAPRSADGEAVGQRSALLQRRARIGARASQDGHTRSLGWQHRDHGPAARQGERPHHDRHGLVRTARRGHRDARQRTRPGLRVHGHLYGHGQAGQSARECGRLVSQPSRLRLLALGHRRLHPDAQSAVPGAVAGHRCRPDTHCLVRQGQSRRISNISKSKNALFFRSCSNNSNYMI